MKFLPIVANDNAVSFTGLTGTTNVVNVLTNDTINGSGATSSNVVMSTVTPNAKLVLNTNGSVDIVNPTPAGIYTMTYKICQPNFPFNCDEATVTVTVIAP